MRKIGYCAVLVILSGAFSVGALAGNSKVVSEGTGDVTISKDGKSVHIVNDSGEYGAVYRVARSKKLLRKLIHLTFTVPLGSDVQGGAPRWSIPVNSDSDPATTEGYAFIDAAGCGAAIYSGPPFAIARIFGPGTVVSTANPACKVFYSGDGQTYDNWNAFVGKTGGAHPTWTLGYGTKDNPDFPFIIADVLGNYTITDIRLSS